MKLLTCLISAIRCSGYIGTFVCFAICNKILNNKYNKTLLIQDRFVLLHLSDKSVFLKDMERMVVLELVLTNRNYPTERQCSNIHDLHIVIALD